MDSRYDVKFQFMMNVPLHTMLKRLSQWYGLKMGALLRHLIVEAHRKAFGSPNLDKLD